MTQTPNSRTHTAPVDLADRYRVDSGPAPMTGVQAVAQQFVEQHQRGASACLGNVATFVSESDGWAEWSGRSGCHSRECSATWFFRTVRALSRAHGRLVAMKVVADVADGLWTVHRPS